MTRPDDNRRAAEDDAKVYAAEGEVEDPADLVTYAQRQPLDVDGEEQP